MDQIVAPGETVEVRPIELKVVSGPATGAARLFDQPSIMVGRSIECSFRVDDPTVSRLHFSLAFVRGRWELTDAGSSSGTAINGQPGGEVGALCVLHDGDRISAGRSVIVVSIESERANAAVDLDFDSGEIIELGQPAQIRPTGPVARKGVARLLPWIIGGVLLAFIVAFAVGSRCSGG